MSDDETTNLTNSSNDEHSEKENLSEDNIENTDADSTDDNDPKITKEFHENVIKYVKLDDLIRKKESEIRELKNSKKPCEKFILDHLDKLGENIIEITNGKLRKNKAETKVPLTVDIIKDTLIDKLTNPELVDEIMKTMDKSRPKTVRVNLKRTSGKK